jgi:hypothetical protein
MCSLPHSITWLARARARTHTHTHTHERLIHNTDLSQLSVQRRPASSKICATPVNFSKKQRDPKLMKTKFFFTLLQRAFLELFKL